MELLTNKELRALSIEELDIERTKASKEPLSANIVAYLDQIKRIKNEKKEE